jgi:hypothetical protein
MRTKPIIMAKRRKVVVEEIQVAGNKKKCRRRK